MCADRMSDVREKLHSQFIGKIQGLLLRFSHVNDDNFCMPLPCRRHAAIGNKNSIGIEESSIGNRISEAFNLFMFSLFTEISCAENSLACSGR